MIVCQKGSLEYLQSGLLDTPHCFSTRFGGVSGGCLASLNLGAHRGDDPKNVWENYRILGESVGFSSEDTVFTKQIHTDVVERVGKGERGRGLLRPVEQGCDGLVTNEEGVALTVFSADCTPILFYDPVVRAIGACHAGWRGTALGIALRTVEKMQAEFGCKAEDIRAAIGPCISECCFETDGDVPVAMRNSLGAEADACIRPEGQKYYVNLKGCNALWLRRAGLQHIEIAEECTACEPERFWSHRRVGNARGSMAAIIVLKGETL